MSATLNTWPPVSDTEETPLLSDELLIANYYVVLDGSGSMGERGCSGRDTKIQVARKAIAAFARSLPQNANFGLAVFTNSEMQELIPLGHDNHNRANDVLSRVDAAGNTPLRSAINLAYRKLTEQGERQQGYGEYHLVVVTDGLASEGEDPIRVVKGMLAESPVNLHTIGFCIGTNHILNQPGRSYYRAADNPEELSKGLEDVLAEAPSFDVVEFNQ
ncbi:MAG: vWA domain-containing protein [Pseudomonadota bacterium]